MWPHQTASNVTLPPPSPSPAPSRAPDMYRIFQKPSNRAIGSLSLFLFRCRRCSVALGVSNMGGSDIPEEVEPWLRNKSEFLDLDRKLMVPRAGRVTPTMCMFMLTMEQSPVYPICCSERNHQCILNRQGLLLVYSFPINHTSGGD